MTKQIKQSCNILSTVTCAERGCKKKIKQNLVARKKRTTGLKCKYHYWIGHGHRSSRATR